MNTPSAPTAGATRRTLGLVIAQGEGERLRPLVRQLARNANLDVVDAHSGDVTPDALLVSSPAALAGIPDRWSGRIAVWSAGHSLSGPDSSGDPVRAGTGDMVVVGPADAVIAAVDDPTDTSVIRIPVARGLMELPEWDPMPTLVRARWRRRLDWPPVIVVPPGYGQPTVPTNTTATATAPIPVDLPAEIGRQVTILGLASVAVVDASTLPLAVALTTPCVCTDPIDDPDLAAIVPTHVADTHAAITAAYALADTLAATEQATRLLIYRHSHGVTAAADALQSALLPDDTPVSLEALARRRCRELDCSPDSPLASRVTEHFAIFAHPTPATGPVP